MTAIDVNIISKELERIGVLEISYIHDTNTHMVRLKDPVTGITSEPVNITKYLVHLKEQDQKCSAHGLINCFTCIQQGKLKFKDNHWETGRLRNDG